MRRRRRGRRVAEPAKCALLEGGGDERRGVIGHREMAHPATQACCRASSNRRLPSKAFKLLLAQWRVSSLKSWATAPTARSALLSRFSSTMKSAYCLGPI